MGLNGQQFEQEPVKDEKALLVSIRFPDGSRKKRTFLKSDSLVVFPLFFMLDPIPHQWVESFQDLFNFCFINNPEKKNRMFKLLTSDQKHLEKAELPIDCCVSDMESLTMSYL